VHGWWAFRYIQHVASDYTEAMAGMTDFVGMGELIAIRLDHGDGQPYIAGTDVAVGRIGWFWRCGYSAREIASLVYKGELTLEQVSAALAVYFANRDTIDLGTGVRRDVPGGRANGNGHMNRKRATGNGERGTADGAVPDDSRHSIGPR